MKKIIIKNNNKQKAVPGREPLFVLIVKNRIIEAEPR